MVWQVALQYSKHLTSEVVWIHVNIPRLLIIIEVYKMVLFSPCWNICVLSFQEFMLELTKHQDSIGNVVKEGNDLITEGKVTAEEENEIRVQMGLLNNRWEELRLKMIERQSKWVTTLWDTCINRNIRGSWCPQCGFPKTSSKETFLVISVLVEVVFASKSSN